MNHQISHHDAEPPPFWRSRYAVGLLVMGAIATYFLLSEHRAHFLGALPLLLSPRLEISRAPPLVRKPSPATHPGRRQA